MDYNGVTPELVATAPLQPKNQKPNSQQVDCIIQGDCLDAKIEPGSINLRSL